MKLADPTLFRQQALTGGAWHNAADGARFAVHNPGNAELVGHAPRCSDADTEHALADKRGVVHDRTKNLISRIYR